MARKSYQRGWVQLRSKRGGNVWVIRYRVRDSKSKTGWKEKTESVPEARNERQARKVLDERIREVNSSNNSPRPLGYTFEGFVSKLWPSYLANKNYKPSTLYSYNSLIENFILPKLGKMPLDDIRPEDLTVFFNGLRAKKVSGKYLVNVYCLVKMMFDLAVEYDLIDTSPVRRKLHRPQWERREKPALSAEEVRKIIENIPDDYRTLFVTVAVTGLRLGELLALRWSNLSIELQQLSVTHNLWRGQLVSPKTKASIKSIRIPSVLVEMLEEHYTRSRWIAPDDFVFCREDGSPLDPDTLRKRVLYPAISAAKIERVSRAHGFHLFRHSAGSIIHAQTRDLKMAQQLLRHSRIDTTADVYVHVDEAVAGEATEALAQLIIPNCGPIAAQSSDRIQ
jgi:integrase